jgi:hypothetical protein
VADETNAPDPTPEPSPSAPTTEELIQTAQAERQRSWELENEKLRLETLLATRRDMPQAAPVHRSDPLDDFTKGMYEASPEENRRRLEAAVNSRASAIAARETRGVEQRVNQRLTEATEALEAQRVLDRVMISNPDIANPDNYTKFGAMMHKAQLDAQGQGLRLSMDQIAQRAVREYRSAYTGGKAPQAPFVEGASAPGYGNPASGVGQPVGPNILEQAYGMPTGEINQISSEAMKQITRDYVKNKNADLRKHGAGNSRIITPVSESIA